MVIVASLVLMGHGAFTLSRTPVDVFPTQQADRQYHRGRRHGAEDIEYISFCSSRRSTACLVSRPAVGFVGRAVVHLRDVRLELDLFRARRRAPVVDGGRPTRGRRAEDGPYQSIMGETAQSPPIGVVEAGRHNACRAARQRFPRGSER
jgi:HME family heavy-metal exporter